jgi:hypothetical protein
MNDGVFFILTAILAIVALVLLAMVVVGLLRMVIQ